MPLDIIVAPDHARVNCTRHSYAGRKEAPKKILAQNARYLRGKSTPLPGSLKEGCPPFPDQSRVTAFLGSQTSHQSYTLAFVEVRKLPKAGQVAHFTKYSIEY